MLKITKFKYFSQQSLPQEGRKGRDQGKNSEGRLKGDEQDSSSQVSTGRDWTGGWKQNVTRIEGKRFSGDPELQENDSRGTQGKGFYQTQVYLGSDLWVQVSLSE